MRNIFLCLMVVACLKAFSEDYKISFTGTGVSTVIDSVKVENLAQSIMITLKGSDTLHLKGTSGIIDLSNNNKTFLQICPNPVMDFSFIEFDNKSIENVKLRIFDIKGKCIISLEQLLSKGEQRFLISGLSSGVFLIKIESQHFNYISKILSFNQGVQKPDIIHLQLKLSTKDKLPATNKLGDISDSQSIIDMKYKSGEILKLTAYSGVYSTVLKLQPTQSQTAIFKFIACTDADGKNYPVLQIGTQLWMAENLNVGIRIDGWTEQKDNNLIEKHCYNNDEKYCDEYGALYLWDEAMQYDTIHNSQGICPEGWHIPSNADWITLTNFLGGEAVAGGMIKEKGITHWNSPNTDATNSSCFTALATGYHYVSFVEFSGLGTSSCFWTSNQYNDAGAWVRSIYNVNANATRTYKAKNYSYSVRCIKD